MLRSATAGLRPRQSSLRTTTERSAIWYPAFLSNRTGNSEAAAREPSFPKMYKRVKEVMPSSVGEPRRPRRRAQPSAGEPGLVEDDCLQPEAPQIPQREQAHQVSSDGA